MKKQLTFILFLLVFGRMISAETLDEERQRQIILDYMHVTGQEFQSAGMALGVDDYEPPVKCGTPAVLEFELNYDKLDKNLLKASGVTLAERPTGLPLTYDTPSGIFRIHYTNTGDDAVRTDMGNYAQTVGLIFDSVYAYLIDTLGYPEPPGDGTYDTVGGDGRFDIYLRDLGSSYFGLTYVDSAFFDGPGSIRATAFMVLDNDYINVLDYGNRPYDAIRVTAAHEFFHVIHFGIDFTEGGSGGSYWMEMTSTWMEEEQYDDINDYYNYLPYFFDDPSVSIQRFRTGTADYHPYASMVYPLFLAERFNRDVIREIWLRCGSYGAGPNSLQAASDVLDSIEANPDAYEGTFSEFALWNYFTGSRADLAPAGIGYSERVDFNVEFDDDITDGPIHRQFSYPLLVTGNTFNPFKPELNAVYYLRFEQLYSLDSLDIDTTFWNCTAGTYPNCTDSVQVTDTTLGYDFQAIDTFFTILVVPDPNIPNKLGMNVLYQFADNPDSVEHEIFLLPTNTGSNYTIKLTHPEQYQSLTFIFTPASENASLYADGNTYYVAYQVTAHSTLSIICPEDEDIFLLQPETICRDILINPLDADVTVSYGSYNNGELCIPFDTAGQYAIELIAQSGEYTDTCSVNYVISLGSLSLVTPYPNPAVVANMANPHVSFKIAIPPGFTSSGTPYLLVDIYNSAGEYIRTLEYEGAFVSGSDFIFNWDLKNQSGKDVASGVYITYARLYNGRNSGEIFTESKDKVVIVR